MSSVMLMNLSNYSAFFLPFLILVGRDAVGMDDVAAATVVALAIGAGVAFKAAAVAVAGI